MNNNPGRQAIRSQDWEEHIKELRRPSPPDRTAVIILGILCGVGAFLLISAWVLLLQEVVGRWGQRQPQRSQVMQHKRGNYESRNT